MMSKRGNTSTCMERSAIEIRSNNTLSDSHMLLFYTKAQLENSSGANACSTLDILASFFCIDRRNYRNKEILIAEILACWVTLSVGIFPRAEEWSKSNPQKWNRYRQISVTTSCEVHSKYTSQTSLQSRIHLAPKPCLNRPDKVFFFIFFFIVKLFFNCLIVKDWTCLCVW